MPRGAVCFGPTLSARQSLHPPTASAPRGAVPAEVPSDSAQVLRVLLGHLCMIPPRRRLQAFNSMPSTGRQLMAVPPLSLPPAHAGFHLQNTGCFPCSTASLCAKPTGTGTAKPTALRPAPPRQRLLARSSQASYSSSGENRKSRRETKTQEHSFKTQPSNASLANTGCMSWGRTLALPIGALPPGALRD